MTRPGVSIDVPDRREPLAAWLRARGFAIERAFTRMGRGPRTEPGTGDGVFAIAGPELG